MWLCGSGTTGCHGLVTVNDSGTLVLLQRHLLLYRHDFLRYVQDKLGHEQGWAWVMRLSESKIRP